MASSPSPTPPSPPLSGASALIPTTNDHSGAHHHYQIPPRPIFTIDVIMNDVKGRPVYRLKADKLKAMKVSEFKTMLTKKLGMSEEASKALRVFISNRWRTPEEILGDCCHQVRPIISESGLTSEAPPPSVRVFNDDRELRVLIKDLGSAGSNSGAADRALEGLKGSTPVSHVRAILCSMKPSMLFVDLFWVQESCVSNIPTLIKIEDKVLLGDLRGAGDGGTIVIQAGLNRAKSPSVKASPPPVRLLSHRAETTARDDDIFQQKVAPSIELNSGATSRQVSASPRARPLPTTRPTPTASTATAYIGTPATSPSPQNPALAPGASAPGVNDPSISPQPQSHVPAQHQSQSSRVASQAAEPSSSLHHVDDIKSPSPEVQVSEATPVKPYAPIEHQQEAPQRQVSEVNTSVASAVMNNDDAAHDKGHNAPSSAVSNPPWETVDAATMSMHSGIMVEVHKTKEGQQAYLAQLAVERQQLQNDIMERAEQYGLVGNSEHHPSSSALASYSLRDAKHDVDTLRLSLAEQARAAREETLRVRQVVHLEQKMWRSTPESLYQYQQHNSTVQIPSSHLQQQQQQQHHIKRSRVVLDDTIASIHNEDVTTATMESRGKTSIDDIELVIEASPERHSGGGTYHDDHMVYHGSGSGGHHLQQHSLQQPTMATQRVMLVGGGGDEEFVEKSHYLSHNATGGGVDRTRHYTAGDAAAVAASLNATFQTSVRDGLARGAPSLRPDSSPKPAVTRPTYRDASQFDSQYINTTQNGGVVTRQQRAAMARSITTPAADRSRRTPPKSMGPQARRTTTPIASRHPHQHHIPVAVTTPAPPAAAAPVPVEKISLSSTAKRSSYRQPYTGGQQAPDATGGRWLSNATTVDIHSGANSGTKKGGLLVVDLGRR